jgi:hypothetical protein
MKFCAMSTGGAGEDRKGASNQFIFNMSVVHMSLLLSNAIGELWTIRIVAVLYHNIYHTNHTEEDDNS